MPGLVIRPFRAIDAVATARIFHDSVHQATGAFYDAAERRAWAPAIPDTDEWCDRLSAQTALVAERNGAVVGFMTLREDARLDFAYVAPDAVGKGVGKALYDAILASARNKGFLRLTTEASLVARPFFERQGWRVLREQTVERNGVSLTNFRMEIDLSVAC
jgi:putative acetyltransferase